MPTIERLANDPWTLVAFGALAGIWLASQGGRRAGAESRGLVGAVCGALALKTVRDVALARMGKIAMQWLQPPEGEQATVTYHS